MRLHRRTVSQIHSPIGAAFATVERRAGNRPLLDMSQAAPSAAPAPEVVEHIAKVAGQPDGARYCPQEGLPHLREAIAAELQAGHTAAGVAPADVTADDVLVTAGCNQAFCLTASALAAPGERVLVQTPHYFNHDMWLRLDGIEPALLPPPHTADAVAASLTDDTRFVVLVSPGNPTGAVIEPDELHAIADVVRDAGTVLILDETYRNFRGIDSPSHTLYSRPDWREYLVTLHSYSKDLALPGYRVGSVVGHPDLLAEVMKLLDCVAIYAPRIGQEAAWAGLTHAGEWRVGQQDLVAERGDRFRSVMAETPGGFELLSSGAYFGWVRAPEHLGGSLAAMERLIAEFDLLTIPGTAFTEHDESMVRFSYANLELDLIDEAAARLRLAGQAS